jgi:hypothetical protein
MTESAKTAYPPCDPETAWDELPAAVVPGLETVQVDARRDRGPGGAHHFYSIRLVSNAALNALIDGAARDLTLIDFQRGPVRECGVNGVTNEALLAIVADRLEGFQQGPFPCEENAVALEGVNRALTALHQRTLARAAQGIEGRTAPHNQADIRLIELLESVGYVLPAAELATWTPGQRYAASTWAKAARRCEDLGDVEVPPIPPHVQQLRAAKCEDLEE